MSTTAWIIIAVVIVVIVLIVAAFLMRQRTARRRAEAQNIRENAEEKVSDLRHREARAEESEALARKAQAESDAKAAEAKRLNEQARVHQGQAVESREDIENEFARADKIDPDVGRDGTRRGADEPIAEDRTGVQQDREPPPETR
ncbi:hypothetical protein AAFP30_07985 [Gordonia sp. CPCC 205515]|uniref:hypothetical protein n=1 Tax=Gordonia sp. CPCC 205515 TaxID=3140791 RepID=UPI003AF38CB9